MPTSPEELYHEAAQSNPIANSEEMEDSDMDSDGNGD
jgi:hypothetical protein